MILFADLHMPEVDGYMLANKIREQYLQVPLIALTANVMQNDLEKIRQSGFNDILLKPYKEKELLNMIGKYAPVVIGENKDEKDSSEKSEQTEIYDLDEIKKFADNDTSILISIIESFIHNNSLNLFTLKDAVTKKDFHTIRNTAHKMLPSYNHFHVYEIIPELKQLEIIQDKSEIDIWNLYTKVESVSKELYVKLDQECSRLKVDVY
ncbi:MAG: response regulator [Bacteroidetes bacterium]|nr:response regulator [Bacteroidota bacterium]